MKKVFLSLVTVVLLASCGGSVNQDAQVKQEGAHQADSSAIELSVSGSYEVSVEGSKVMWEGNKVIGGGHVGGITVQSGNVEVSEGTVVRAMIIIDMKTINEVDAGSEEYAAKLEGHLMAPDFFNVDSFPTATIKVKSIKNGNATADLTIKDVTKEVVFPITVTVAESEVVTEAKFSINRTDWGIVYGSGNFFADLAKDKIINDEIKFDVTLVAKK